MRNLFLFISYLVVTFIVWPTFAAKVTFGVLDEQIVMTKSNRIQMIVTKLQQQFGAQSQSLKSQHIKLQNMVNKYNKNYTRMSAEELKLHQHAIDNKQRELQRKQADFSDNFLAAKQLEVEKIVAQLRKIVTRIAKRKDLDLVFFQDVVVYNDPMLDITDRVTAAVK